MYKNAERVLEEKHDMNKATIRGAVAQARIDQNIRRVTSMIHLIQPPAHDEVILPKNSGKDAPGGGARGGAAGGDLSVDADISSTNPLFAGMNLYAQRYIVMHTQSMVTILYFHLPLYSINRMRSRHSTILMSFACACTYLNISLCRSDGFRRSHDEITSGEIG